jgi:amino acid transporter
MEVMFLTFSALTPAASVFVYGNAILHMAGTGAATAILVGGGVAAMAALLYAELGAAFPKAGGVYPSLVGVLGPFCTFPYIAMMMLLAPATLAFTLLGFADYVRFLDPALPELPAAFGCLVLASGVAMLRIRTGALLTGIFLGIEGIALVTLVILALAHPARSLGVVLAHPVVLDHQTMKPLTAAVLGLAVVSGVFTTGGASWAMYFGEELKDAARRIGPVIGWTGLLAALSIAVPLILVVLSAADLNHILSAQSPVAAYMTQTGGPGLAAAVSAGLVVAIFNAIVATIMAYSRLLYATGRDGVWPALISRPLGRLQPTLRSPVIAILALGLFGAAMLLLGEQALLILSAGENIVEYPLMAVAVFIGRRLGRTGVNYRAPLHPLLPIMALAATIGFVAADWFDPDAGRPSLLVLLAVVLVSLVYYRFRMHKRTNAWGAPTELIITSEAVEPL